MVALQIPGFKRGDEGYIRGIIAHLLPLQAGKSKRDPEAKGFLTQAHIGASTSRL